MTIERIRIYADFEDALNDMARAEDAANAAITPRQHRHLAVAATNPTYWFRVLDNYLVILGESQPLTFQANREVELGGDEGEYGFAYERFEGRHERGYLFGPCYSVVEPEGELGSTHVSQVVWIDPPEFHAFRNGGWLSQNLSRENHIALQRASEETWGIAP